MKSAIKLLARLFGRAAVLVGCILTTASIGPIYMLLPGQISPGDRMFGDIPAPSLFVAVVQPLIGLALAALSMNLTAPVPRS